MTRRWYDSIGSTQDSDGKFIKHKVIEEINKEVASGQPWSKCANCGDPFPGIGTICSDYCEQEFLTSLREDLM